MGDGERETSAVIAPGFPLDEGQVRAVAYAVAILRALKDATDADGHPTPGNTERAAIALGMPRRTLDYHIAQLGLRELQSGLWNRSVRQPPRRKK